MEEGSIVTPASYLHQNAYVTYRNPAGVDGGLYVE